MHLPLVHEAFLVLVEELDRVLDRDYVVVAIGVDQVDEAGEGSRLSGPGGTGYQHESLRQVSQLADRPGKPKVVRALDLVRDDAVDTSWALAVLEQVAAEAAQPRDLIGEIGVVGLLELLEFPFGRDLEQRAQGGLCVKHLVSLYLHEISVDTHHRFRARSDVEV